MRLFGHPIHTMLVAFPLALLVLAPVWDGIAWLGIMADARTAGYFCTLGGLVAGLIAAGLYGVEHELALEPPCTTNAYERKGARIPPTRLMPGRYRAIKPRAESGSQLLPVVRRLPRDRDVVDVPLADAGLGDAEEAAAGLHRPQVAVAGVTHRRLQAAD